MHCLMTPPWPPRPSWPPSPRGAGPFLCVREREGEGGRTGGERGLELPLPERTRLSLLLLLFASSPEEKRKEEEKKKTVKKRANHFFAWLLALSLLSSPLSSMPPAVFGGLLSARQPAGRALLSAAAAACTYYLSWLLSLVRCRKREGSCFYFSAHRADRQPSTCPRPLRPPSLPPSLSLPPLPAALSLPLLRVRLTARLYFSENKNETNRKQQQPLHASFPKLAALYPRREAAAALVTALGRATALATVVYCVWVFAIAAVVKDDEHKGPAELAEERKQQQQGSSKNKRA